MGFVGRIPYCSHDCEHVSRHISILIIIIANPERLVHAFFVLYNLQWLWSRFVGTRVHQCPNCHNNFIVGQPEASKPSQKKEGYSLLRGEVYLEEEEEPVPYTDMRSMEVGQAAAPKEDSKGKDILSV